MAPAPDLNDLIATVTADAAERRPPGTAGHRVGGGGRARRGRRRAGRPLRRRVPRRRPHLGGDQRVARRVAPGRPQEVLGDPPRPRALDAARPPGARARRQHRGRLRARLRRHRAPAARALPARRHRRADPRRLRPHRRRPSPTRCSPRAPRNDTGPADPPFTPLAAQVLGGALTEAISMGHNYIGTEHLLLGLFGQPEGLAAQILAGAGATHAEVKAKVVQMPRRPS